jgi:nicotinamide-nucleotide amidase
MRHLVEDRLLPKLRETRSPRAVVHIGTVGIGESHLQDLLGDLKKYFNNGLRLAYLPALTGLKLRVTVTDATTKRAEARAADVVAEIKSRAIDYVFSTDGSSLEAVVGRELAARGLTVALAESCTGGRVADRLTDVVGASRYILAGVVAYSNTAKVELLGVHPETLDHHGAVSEDVAREMAEGVRLRVGADFGGSTTGILGPDGGTPAKPVGTVWIAVADSRGTTTRRLALGIGREENKMRASTALLNLLRLRVMAAD